MNCYIIHYTKYKERLDNYRDVLIPKLKELGFIKDVRIISSYDREDPFIKSIGNTGLKTGELSCSKKHFEAWRLFKESGDNLCMVLEDDLLIEEGVDFMGEFMNMYNNIKENYNIITFGSGLQMHAKSKGFTGNKKGRCTDSYIISRRFLEYHEKENYLIPIGHYMNEIVSKNGDMWYWYEPTIFKQGSQNDYYKTDIRNY